MIKKIDEIIKKNEKVFNEIGSISKDFSTEDKAKLFIKILCECSKEKEFAFLFTMGSSNIKDPFTTITNMQQSDMVINLLESIAQDKKISDLQQENKALKEQIETMKKEIDDLRDAWNNEINLNSASENNDPLCPSCGHNLQCFDCGDLF